MKKLLFFFVLITTTISYAQEKDEKFKIEKGTWGVSGQFSAGINKTTFESEPDAESSNFNFNIFPSTEYFISDNLSLGLRLGFGHWKNDSSSPTADSEGTTNNYSVAAFGRKYFSISKRLAFTLQGELSYSNRDQDSSDSLGNTGGSIRNTFEINVRPGIVFLVNKNISLNANVGRLGYSHSNSRSKTLDTSKTYNNGFNLNLDATSFILGLTFYL